jgi:serine/threonine protein kinase
MSNLDLKRIAKSYARSRGLILADHLGTGTDGSVWKTKMQGVNDMTVIKAFQAQKNYLMELGCYQRLGNHNISKLGRFAIPSMVDFSDDLLVIEMSIVTAPYLLDFGKAYLDSEPDHSQETWSYYHQEQRDIWEDKYDEVQSLLAQLRNIGIFYRDPKPGNIMFEPDDQTHA